MSRIASIKQMGQGLALPLLPNELSRGMQWSQGPDKVKQSIYVILDTEPGERLMRPDFGCGLRRHIMEPNTAATRTLIQHSVELALNKWEPRINLDKVTVSASNDPSVVLIDVHYTHRRDGSTDNFVYPFYLG